MRKIRILFISIACLTMVVSYSSCIVVTKEHPGKSPHWHYRHYPPGPPPHSNAGGNHPDQHKSQNQKQYPNQGNTKNNNNKSKKKASTNNGNDKSGKHPDKKAVPGKTNKSKHPDGY